MSRWAAFFSAQKERKKSARPQKFFFISALNYLNVVNFHFKRCFLDFFIFLFIFIRQINFLWILVTFSQSEKTLCKNKKNVFDSNFWRKKILSFFSVVFFVFTAWKTFSNFRVFPFLKVFGNIGDIWRMLEKLNLYFL